MPVTRSFAAAYTAQHPEEAARARAFLGDEFRAAPTRIARARQERTPVTAEVLAAVTRTTLLHQDHAALRASLAKLAAGAAVVVTGQQVGLFGGPLYSYYKAASAVAIARALEAESGVPCVPLFWLQTEDHDFAEIASACVPRTGEGVRSALRTDAAHDGRRRAPRWRIARWGREIDALAPSALEASALAQRPARGRRTPARLRRRLSAREVAWRRRSACSTARCSPSMGLLLLDPRQPGDRHAAAVPLYEQARCVITPSIARAARRSCARHRAQAGFDVQVPIRAGHSLVFFHQGGAAGDRFRVRADEAGQAVAELATAPLRFSSSALLRPLLQDRIFPTVAYVGGPGELSYFAQLPPLYELLETRLPLVIPRARFRVVDHRARARLAELAGCAELSATTSRWRVLVARLAWHGDAGTISPSICMSLMSSVEQALSAVGDAALDRARLRTSASIDRAVRRFVGRWERLVVERSTSLAATMARLWFAWPRRSAAGACMVSAVAVLGPLRRVGAGTRLQTGAIVPFSSSLLEIGGEIGA